MYVTRIFVIPKRFERLTHALEGRCSIQLSYGTILNCGAKVGTFVDMCKKNRKNVSKLRLVLDFLLVHLRPSQNILHEMEGFTSPEVSVLAHGVVEIFLVALQ